MKTKWWMICLGMGLGSLTWSGNAAVLVSAQESEEHRTGRPFDVAPWAMPSNTHSYLGYLVGGGCSHRRKGDGPTAEEGTWGWDYRGWLLPRRVNLGWWHGRRYQGGSGAYKTDGPHVLPHLEEKGEENGASHEAANGEH